MPSSLFGLLFSVALLLTLIDQTVSTKDPSNLQLSVYPNSGYSVDNIEIRCQVFEPSVYDNVYLFVKTDNVKPSGILVMADTTISECRINENKRKYIHIHICNSSAIIINVNHEIINDSLHSIEYACSQGDASVFTSFRILKEQTVQRYYDQKSTSSSSTLTYTHLLLLFILAIIGEVR